VSGVEVQQPANDGEGEFLKHLVNFVNALIALAPSRNYITQFIFLIKLNEMKENYYDYAEGINFRILESAYPEIVNNEKMRNAFSKIFGISFKEKVTLERNSLGDIIANFLLQILPFFANDELRSELNSLLKDRFPQGVPDLVEEWTSVVLKGLASEPTLGNVVIRVLKELVKRGSAKVEDLEKSLGVARWDLVDALTLCKLYGLVKLDSRGHYYSSEALKKYSHLLESLKG